MKNQKMIMKFLLGLLFLSPILSFSQNQTLFKIANGKELLLSESNLKKIENLRKNKVFKNVEFIELISVSRISKTNNGLLPVNVPGTDKLYIARPFEIEYVSEKDFVWKGEFNAVDGYLKLICKGGEVYGNIQINDRFFEIQSFEEGKNIIIEYDKANLEKMTCGSLHKENNFKENLSDDKIPKSVAATKTRSIVRVLVLYTDAAEMAVTNINNTANLAISQMNDALRNSEVNSSLYMSLAGIEPLAFTESTFNIFEDIDNLSENAIVADLRDVNEADLVVLLTDGNYTNGYSTYYGIVDEIGPDNANAYAIVEADVSTSSKYTFAHEVCHLFGGRHDNDPSGTYEHGYTFKTGIWPFRKTRATIMYWTPGDYILHYSNPDVEYKNKSTGTTSSNDVARKMEVEASVVEAFRVYTPPLDAYISGPTKGNNSGTYTWNAIVSNGTIPYSYLWEYSLNGFNYTGTLGTSSSITAQLPLDSNLSLRLTVTSADGQTDVAYHFVINMDAEFGLESTEVIPNNTENKTVAKNLRSEIIVSIPEITIYPNPVSNHATISYYVSDNCKVSIEVFDINGKKIETILNKIQNKGRYLAQLNTSGYKSGFYFCKLLIDGKSYSNKFIVE